MIRIYSLCFLLCLSFLQLSVQAKEVFGSDTTTSYELALSFDTTENLLTGTAKIPVAAGEDLVLSVNHLRVTGAFIRDASGRERMLHPTHSTIDIQSQTTSRTIYISYEKTVGKDYTNIISDKGISLTNSWYPYPSKPYLFSISANLPKGFTAITESDNFPLTTSSGNTRSSWSRPTANISYIAGPYETKKIKVRDSLYVYSMFFKEDKELAQGYLEAAAKYIHKYEEEIGPFPYNHYVIVANRLPTGYGMPTFTLIGQMVLRLPFIKSSSLGHEIVHSWFGNDVTVDYTQGNWSEGLTSFLADHSFRAAEGYGVEDRKASLIKYHSYVNSSDRDSFTLGDFTSASHNQPLANAKRAVGYNAGAFFFHELREHLGYSVFTDGIKDFYKANSGRSASWKDIQSSFERVSGKDLQSFFLNRLTMKTPPTISATDISVESRSGIKLNFTLSQALNKSIPLTIPIHVTTMSGVSVFTEELTTTKKSVSLSLNEVPLSFTLDPEFSLLRQLTPQETSPVWSQFLGADKKLIILASEEDRSKYSPILDSLKKYKPTVAIADSVTNQMLSENNLLFLNPDQAPCTSIFGNVTHNNNSLTVDIRKNPLRPEFVAVILSDNSTTQRPSVARRLSHYGKYSYIQFNDDGTVEKRITPSENGIRYELERLPSGGATSALTSFDHIIEALLKKRVIYLGETHTSLADHLLQLRIIEALYMYDPKIAIGMEMFPVSSQKSLDAFTRPDSTMNEKTFLKESDYFNVWRYDYRLFRDILNFARDKNLMVKGINIDRKIVSNVFRAGNTDSLSDEEKSKLVPERKLDLPGYQERLAVIHNAHISGNHGTGASSGFIQSQAIWDESMAANIVSFLKEYPDHKMVVIAGNQHTRKDSGIPPRVFSRLPVEQSSLINIYEGSYPENIQETADYFFLADNVSLPQSPKIGLVLSEPAGEDSPKGLLIDQISPHGKAGEAGLEVGDLLVRLGNDPIENMTDLRISMIDARQKDTIEVEVLRGKVEKKNLVFQVELTIPKMGERHP